MEQAGAHIATDRIGFARYLKLWGESREKALAWADATVTGSDRTLATTWATSVAQLSPESRRLLDRLAFLAPDPVPDRSSTSPFPARRRALTPIKRCGGLYAYSLVSRVSAEDGGAPGFVVHRLVQDFARRAMSEERRTQALRRRWSGSAQPLSAIRSDVKNWPILDPLASHASPLRGMPTKAEIAAPTARLFNDVGVLLYAKADYTRPSRSTPVR